MAFKKGWAAVSQATTEESQRGGDFTSFKSGDTKVVKFKSLDDVAGYNAYGVFQQVNTFVPENPAVFNERGFVEKNPTSWDKAAQHYYDRAKKDETNEKELKKLGYKYAAKQRFMIAVFDVQTGEDIVIDLTKPQAGSVMDSLMDYAETDEDGNVIEGADHDFNDMVFKLSKKGSGTNTVVTLSPIVNLAKGLTKEEKENFESDAAKQPIPDDIFDDLLFTLDDDDMLRGLAKCGFDLSIIGEVAPPPKDELGNTAPEESTENPEDDF